MVTILFSYTSKGNINLIVLGLSYAFVSQQISWFTVASVYMTPDINDFTIDIQSMARTECPPAKSQYQ